MILAILNQKGGAGKTTTAINLAAALAAEGASVRLLDADSQQQAAIFYLENVEVLPTPDKAALTRAVKHSTADWTIIDCPPSLAEAAPALPLANIIIAPVPPRFQDLAGLAQLRETVDVVRERGNSHLQLYILITMRDGRISLHSEYEGQLRAAFGPEVLRTVIPRTAVFENAASAHLPVQEYSCASVAAKAFRALATEIKELQKT